MTSKRQEEQHSKDRLASVRTMRTWAACALLFTLLAGCGGNAGGAGGALENTPKTTEAITPGKV